MYTPYLVPIPGQSIAISLTALNLQQRQVTALLWMNSSIGEAPLKRVENQMKATAYSVPAEGSIASVLIRELGVNLEEAQSQNQAGFPETLSPLNSASFGAKLLILSIAVFLLSPANPADLKPGQAALISQWATYLGIFPDDIKPYLQSNGPQLYRFMMGKKTSEN